MRRESRLRGIKNILFYLTLAFICGNLTATSVLGEATSLKILFHSAIAQLLIISLLITNLLIISYVKRSHLLLYVPIFFVLGYSSYALSEAIGGYNYLSEWRDIGFIKNLKGLFKGMIALENESERSLLEALTIGDKTHIPPPLKEAYKRSGAMHLLALSGLHVGIIYTILDKLLSPLPKIGVWRIVRGCFIVTFLLFYALFTGASPSICRAVIMSTVYEIGKLIGREKHGLNSLSITAIIITLLHPSALSSISFQLSFTAMLGVYLIYPHLKEVATMWLKYKPFIKIWEVATLSLSCQIFTTPLTLYYFGSMPLTSLLTNTLAMPLVTIITAIAPIATVISKVPFIGPWSNTILSLLIRIMNKLIEIISQIL